MPTDPNAEAARVVRKVTDPGTPPPLPADVEAAWQRWVKGVQKVDERVRTLLRAAFEAGVEAGARKQR
jgi:hypothetical protein